MHQACVMCMNMQWFGTLPQTNNQPQRWHNILCAVTLCLRCPFSRPIIPTHPHIHDTMPDSCDQPLMPLRFSCSSRYKASAPARASAGLPCKKDVPELSADVSMLPTQVQPWQSPRTPIQSSGTRTTAQQPLVCSCSDIFDWWTCRPNVAPSRQNCLQTCRLPLPPAPSHTAYATPSQCSARRVSCALVNGAG
jgi:hypothetical protein